MALSNKEKQQALRDRRAKLGQKGRLIYLTDSELKEVKSLIAKMRESSD